MTPERLFSLCNTFALIGWLILTVAGRTRWASRIATGVVIPLVIAVLYAGLVAAHWGDAQGGFGTLEGVAELFSNRWLLLAGWIHYLAFDLFIGSWEVRDAQALGISHFIVIPCLVLTFLFGPAGLLLYFIIRVARTRALAI
jgi:ABA4-like protein